MRINTQLKPMGYMIRSDTDTDKIVERATLMCVHCGRHWVMKPGSGNVRGFCLRCNGPICSKTCAECRPVELLLENLEQSRPADYRPIRVSVSKIVLP